MCDNTRANIAEKRCACGMTYKIFPEGVRERVGKVQQMPSQPIIPVVDVFNNIPIFERLVLKRLNKNHLTQLSAIFKRWKPVLPALFPLRFNLDDCLTGTCTICTV